MQQPIDLQSHFAFEGNVVYENRDLPAGLSFKQLTAIHHQVFVEHLQHCDADIRDSWQAGKHLSMDWGNFEAVDKIAGELSELLKSLAYVDKIAIGLYHGNSLVLSIGYNSPALAELKVPWFYKGFTIKHDLHVPLANPPDSDGNVEQ
jgi:hypothetical protein